MLDAIDGSTLKAIDVTGPGGGATANRIELGIHDIADGAVIDINDVGMVRLAGAVGEGVTIRGATFLGLDQDAFASLFVDRVAHDISGVVNVMMTQPFSGVGALDTRIGGAQAAELVGGVAAGGHLTVDVGAYPNLWLSGDLVTGNQGTLAVLGDGLGAVVTLNGSTPGTATLDLEVGRSSLSFTTFRDNVSDYRLLLSQAEDRTVFTSLTVGGGTNMEIVVDNTSGAALATGFNHVDASTLDGSLVADLRDADEVTVRGSSSADRFILDTAPAAGPGDSLTGYALNTLAGLDAGDIIQFDLIGEKHVDAGISVVDSLDGLSLGQALYQLLQDAPAADAATVVWLRHQDSDYLVALDGEDHIGVVQLVGLASDQGLSHVPGAEAGQIDIVVA